MNGAEVLLKALEKQGVDTIFGYPGGAVLPLYDALYKYNKFNHIRAAHEQGGVHAADGYARSTGKVGVFFATSGPGATNTVTGIATAYMDSVPLVIITGQVISSGLGKDSFQEVDITGITFSITKHSYLVRKVEDIPSIIEKAFIIAKSGRPGPVLIDIPKDIFIKEFKESYINNNEKNNLSNKQKTLDESKIDKIVELISQSNKPIIHAGGGINITGASNELIDLAVKADIPVVNTMMGLGSIPRDHPLSLGMLGMHGFKKNNLAVSNCDLLIAIGSRFSDRVIGSPKTFASKAKIVHIDIDSSEIDKNITCNVSIVGDIKYILNKITNKLKQKKNEKWKDEIKGWKVKDNIKESAFHPKNIIKELQKKLGDHTIVATDVGQHQMWTAQYWDFKKPNTFLTSGGLGTMGFGLGAAIGGKLGKKQNPVLLITGDGSFRMNCNELFTVRKYDIPLTIVLFNNRTLGMVRQWQSIFFEKNYSHSDIDDGFDYVSLAKTYKIEGYSVNSIKELKAILKNIEFNKKPIFLECKIDMDENVYPIVPPGESIDKVILK